VSEIEMLAEFANVVSAEAAARAFPPTMLDD